MRAGRIGNGTGKGKKPRHKQKKEAAAEIWHALAQAVQVTDGAMSDLPSADASAAAAGPLCGDFGLRKPLVFGVAARRDEGY